MGFIRKLLGLSAFTLLAACTPVGERTQLSVGYYSVRGNSFAELDKQISLHGPTVSGVGKALAATNIKMIPDIRFRHVGKVCKVTHARMTVQARVTLPRLVNRKTVRKDLEKAWTNLQEYAQLHEAVHVVIADNFALRIEDALLALPGNPTCAQTEKEAHTVSAELLKQHREEQLKFDEDEKSRIKLLLRKQNS